MSLLAIAAEDPLTQEAPSLANRPADPIPTSGEHIMIIYHSHTAGPAIPSHLDVTYARPDVQYLIVATETNVARAFMMADGWVAEQTVLTVP